MEDQVINKYAVCRCSAMEQGPRRRESAERGASEELLRTVVGEGRTHRVFRGRPEAGGGGQVAVQDASLPCSTPEGAVGAPLGNASREAGWDEPWAEGSEVRCEESLGLLPAGRLRVR